MDLTIEEKLALNDKLDRLLRILNESVRHCDDIIGHKGKDEDDASVLYEGILAEIHGSMNEVIYRAGYLLEGLMTIKSELHQ